MLGRGRYTWVGPLALVVAIVALLLPAAAQASPACDPSMTLPDVQSGASTQGVLTCDDPGGTGLNFAIATDPAHGSAFVDGAVNVSYTADFYAGHDSFGVAFTDNEGGETDVTVGVDVTNTKPTCQPVNLGSVAHG